MSRRMGSIGVLLLVCSAWIEDARAQLAAPDLPHSYTVASPIPAGCLFAIPTALPVPVEVDLSYDELVSATDLDGDAAVVRVRVWRFACYEPDRSVVMVNLDIVSGSDALDTPTVTLQDNSNQIVPARLFYQTGRPPVAAGEAGRADTLQATAIDGVSYVVEPAVPVTQAFYNGFLSLTLDWGNGQTFFAPVFVYDAEIDAPQSVAPPFHGRYSGQWTAEGLPRAGLQLLFAEIPFTDRNFVFAVWFTYAGGLPIWVVGNTDFAAGANEIEIPMLSLVGGDFITRPGSYSGDDVQVDTIGTMTIRARHCNEIEVDLDFTPVDEGTAVLTLTRLIRIAGYDCDQTRD
jgi:hypothetical protein